MISLTSKISLLQSQKQTIMTRALAAFLPCSSACFAHVVLGLPFVKNKSSSIIQSCHSFPCLRSHCHRSFEGKKTTTHQNGHQEHNMHHQQLPPTTIKPHHNLSHFVLSFSPYATKPKLNNPHLRHKHGN